MPDPIRETTGYTILADGDAEAFRPTMQLRWSRPPNTTTRPDVLQQAWAGDRGTVIWRPVPVEIIPDGR